MEDIKLRRSRRIQSLSEDEASVASSTRTPRKSNVGRDGKSGSSTEKVAKKKKLGAIPEAVDIEQVKTTEITAESIISAGGHAKKDDAAKDDGNVTVPTFMSDSKKKGRRKRSRSIPSEEEQVAQKKIDRKQSIPSQEEVADDLPTPKPTIEKATIGTQKLLGKNALKKLQREQGVDTQMGAKEVTSSPSIPVSSKKKKKLSKDELGAEVVADCQLTTAATVSKTKRTKGKSPEIKPKAEEVADDLPTSKPTIEKATIGTQKLLGKNALTKLQREQGVDTQMGAKEVASSPSIPVSSKKKKKLSKDELGADDVADCQLTTTATVSKTKRTKGIMFKIKRMADEVADDLPTPKPTIEKATIGTQKLLEKNALTKLQREQGVYTQMGAKEVTSSPSIPVSSKKKKKLSKDELGADDADCQLTTTATVSKTKRTKGISPEIKPKKKKLSKEDKKSDNIVKGKSHQPPSVNESKQLFDVKVHRMRFLKLHQRAILSMSSTPSPGIISSRPKLHHPGRLAISRQGGSVELLSPNDRWVSVGDIPGVRGREVDAMVWICGTQFMKDDDNMKIAGGSENASIGPQDAPLCRLVDEKMHLFGCSRDGTIFELDFATKCQKGVIGSGGGGVFCMTSLCSRGGCCGFQDNDDRPNRGSCGGYFAAGCEDGSVKVYTAFGSSGGDFASEGPTLVATLPSAGNAILSLAWLPGHSGRDDGGMGGSVIFAGVADGSIRRFDCTTSVTSGPISTGSTIALSRGSVSVSYRWKSSLRMTVENRGLREATKVWALKALSDGTVISGDSLGHVQIWDGMAGTMTQSFDHNENGADVLCLAVSEDENKIFASGIDSSVRCIERQSLSVYTGIEQGSMNDSMPSRKWISSISHRKHSHDVRALAICHKETNFKSKPLELLVSGSIDTRICSYVANDFKTSRPKVWYNWPSRSQVSISCKQRLLAVTRDDRIDLYRFASPDMVDPAKIMYPETRDESKSLVKTIFIKSRYNLCCSTISDDGKFLAASDALSLYLFSLEVEDEDGILDVRPTRLDLRNVCKRPATSLRFDGKERLVCATIDGPINILKISSASETKSSDSRSYIVSLEHVFNEHTVGWSCKSHHFPIVNLDLSPDGTWLSAGRFSSDNGSVHVFTLSVNGGVERYQHWWALPGMDAPTTCIKFLGGGDIEASLAVGCSTNEFYIFNLDRRALSHWSNDMGLPPLKALPKELTSRSEPLTRIVSNPADPQCFILGSHGYFCVVDLDQPVPERSIMFPPDHLRAQRLQMIKSDDTSNDYSAPKRETKKIVGSCASNFAVCLRYNEILFQGFLAENEMVVVEEPWMSILEELPDALARRVYGM